MEKMIVLCAAGMEVWSSAERVLPCTKPLLAKHAGNFKLLTAADSDKITVLVVHELITAGCLCQAGVVHGYWHSIGALTLATKVVVLAVHCAHAESFLDGSGSSLQSLRQSKVTVKSCA